MPNNRYSPKRITPQDDRPTRRQEYSEAVSARRRLRAQQTGKSLPPVEEHKQDAASYARENYRASQVRSRTSRSKHGKMDPKTAPRRHKQNFIARLANQWFDRVMGAMRGDGLSASAEEYASHRTTRDFIWNTAGSAAWAFVFPIVTMVSTQVVGVEQAGMISMAFVVAILLMFLGNFGVRTYQASDLEHEHSFLDYQANRLVTCALMLIAGLGYCTLRGYDTEMFNISMAVILYKGVDALADVYEGRLQQQDKLYLAGISQTIRSVLAIVVFSIVLVVSHNSVAACCGMAIAAAITFVVITWPLALLETPKSRAFNMKSFVKLFKMAAPLFVAIFFFNVIENMPKFAMEGALPYDNQLYYNALYFPAQMILISAQLVYKPLLVRMASVWQDSSKRRKFDLILFGIIAVIVVITVLVWLVMFWFGLSIMNLLYGIDFYPYRGLLGLMLITGGITAAIDFLYQMITIMRRQKDVVVLFCMTFIFSLFIPALLVQYSGLEGAVLSYVIIEAILFVLLGWEYFRIRWDLAKGMSRTSNMDASDVHERTTFVPLIDIADPKMSEAEDESGVEEEVKLRPSQVRAERQHREEVLRKRLRK